MHQPEHQRVNRLKRLRGSPDSEEIKNIFDPNKSQRSSLKRSPLVLSIPGTSEQNKTFQPIPNPDPGPVPSLDQRLGSQNPLPFLESSLQSTAKKEVNLEVEKNAGREALEKGGSYVEMFDETAGHGTASSQDDRVVVPDSLKRRNPFLFYQPDAKMIDETAESDAEEVASVTPSETPSETDYDADHGADSEEEDSEVSKLLAGSNLGNRSEEFEYRSPYPWWKIW